MHILNGSTRARRVSPGLLAPGLLAPALLALVLGVSDAAASDGAAGLSAPQAAPLAAQLADPSSDALLLAEAELETKRRGRRFQPEGEAAATPGAADEAVTERRGRRGSSHAAPEGDSAETRALANSRAGGSRRGTRGGGSEAEEVAPVMVASLDQFLAALHAPSQPWDEAMVLVAFDATVDRPARTLWVARLVAQADGTIAGAVAADARLGQQDLAAEPVAFAPDRVRDWGYFAGGQSHGFATLRAPTPGEGGTDELAAVLPGEAAPKGW